MEYATSFVLMLFVFYFLMLIIGVAFYVWSSLAMMAVFKKAEHPHPWSAWIPFYRDYVFFEVGGQTGWFMFLAIGAGVITSLGTDAYSHTGSFASFGGFLLSAAALVFTIFSIVNINKALGKHVVGFTILAVLLPLIWLSIIGWDRSKFSAALANGPMVPGKGHTFLEEAKQKQGAGSAETAANS